MDRATLSLALAVGAAVAAEAAEISGWRGDGSGRFPSANPPLHWTADSNVVWKTEMPSWGNGSPVPAGDRIFLGAEPTLLVCVSQSDGSILWQATNSYLDALSPEEVEKARAMQAQAEAVRNRIRDTERQRNEKQKQLDPINAIRSRMNDLQRKLELMTKPDELAGRIAEVEKQAGGAAAALAEKPDDGGRKRRHEELTRELALLRDKELVAKGIADAGNELAPKEAEEKELKESIDAFNRRIGELRNELKPLEKYDMPSTHGANGYSTHTAVSDGTDVFVLRGHGMAACYSLSGERRWIRFIARSTEGWGHSASPVLVDDLFVVQMQGLTALDRKTGETVWTAPDARARWGSPIVVRIGGEAVIVTPGGDFVRARDGAMLAAKLLGLEYCAPVADDGVVYFIQKGGKAFKLPEKIGGEFKPEQLWTASEIPGDRYYASPVVHDGLVYAINQQSHLVVIDATTGAPVYDRKLDLKATVYPSITLVGGHLLACGENGNTAVFEPGREYREIARNPLEAFRSCPVAKGDRLYIRGMKHLYCIGAGGR
ncbi:MAG: hypothetical protein FJ225_00800 [Lentisphaerae bacterium]|nr:hypothetical protein [Lentisphaerota bacterium]